MPPPIVLKSSKVEMMVYTCRARNNNSREKMKAVTGTNLACVHTTAY